MKFSLSGDQSFEMELRLTLWLVADYKTDT